ncbi:MAG: hypothetical protein LH660_01325, partial [Phormidesmis sp. CAN_BIN36]|nr:hypothetical protein [Phormidesmis sp. CAN_BIN36]
GFLAPFSPGRRVGEGFAPLREEGNSYLHSATPKKLLILYSGDLLNSLSASVISANRSRIWGFC